MNGIRRLKTCCLFSMFLFGIAYIIIFNSQSKTFPSDRSHKKSSRCIVPDVDPFHESVKRFYELRDRHTCEGKPSFIKVHGGNTLTINRGVLKDYYKEDLDKCYYKAVRRGTDDLEHPDDRVIIELRKDSNFSTKITVKDDEFVNVICEDKNSNAFFEELKALVVEKQAVEKRCSEIKRAFPGEKLSILVFGIDSVSRLNFHRHFTKTYKFLKYCGAVELMSYNKVGGGTIENMIPLLTGNFLSHYWREGQPTSFDHVDALWKYFSARGYRTLFMEDAPEFGMFNFEKTGFYQPPTDYYYRPFATALEASDRKKGSFQHCIEDELEFKFVLDWGKLFAKKFKNSPYFQWTFLTRLTHNQLNYAGYADQPTFSFFKDLHEDDALNKTLVVFMSDHGIRYGDIRLTEVGKMEENNPFFFFLLPDWFKEIHPEVVENLKTNQRRLTTPFDVHETLKDVLNYFVGDPKSLRNTDSSENVPGMSLFREIPSSRTCSDAFIPKNYCSCDLYVDSDDVHTATKAAKFSVAHINSILENVIDKCAKLMLGHVISAKVKETVGDSRYHQVMFVVRPGNGQFEVDIEESVKTKGNFEIIGHISRINQYRNQSHCVHSRFLKSYCYCKLQGKL